MSTLRVSNIEAKADASSPTIDEKVKITSSDGRVLVQIDGKNAGITSIGINTTSTSFTIDGNQNVQFVGVITAANVNTTGVSTFTSITATTVNATSIVGVNTLGVTTAYIGSVVGNLTGNVTGNLNSSGVSTITTLQTGAIQTTAGKPILNSTGSVLQVVNALTTTQSTNANVAGGTNFDLLSASISPYSSTSKILIIVSVQVWMQNGSAAVMYGKGSILRGGTLIAGNAAAESVIGSIFEWGHRYNLTYLDSPSTTSNITYTLRWTHENPLPITNLVFHRNSSPATLTLLEISA
jgi:hypothetical protein